MRYFIKFNPSRQFVEKLYRLTEENRLQYYGEQGGWHASFSFAASEVTEEVTKEEMDEYIRISNL